jgi:hypothetical protein
MKVSWDDDIANIWRKKKVPNHQPLTVRNGFAMENDILQPNNPGFYHVYHEAMKLVALPSKHWL